MGAELHLDDTHGVQVVDHPEGPRAAPVVRVGGEWRRASAGDGVAVALVRRLYDEAPVADGFRITVPERSAGLVSESERDMGVDQTHRSWVVGDQVVVKWMTEPLVGPHPAASRLRRLADSGFAESPALWGLVEWREPGTGHWVPVAVVQSYLPGTEDGWTWAVEESRRAFGLEPGEPTDFGSDLGGVVGRMHLALADDPPDRMTTGLARQHAGEALEVLDLAVRLTEPHDPESHALLSGHRPRIAEVLTGLAGAAGSAVLPIHGDLHVGQVLRGPDGGYSVVDFDGNPTRSAPLRAEQAPAAFDVAGMLVCLENVGHVARHGVRDVTEESAVTWTGMVQSHFLTGYRAALGGHLGLYDEALVPAYAWEQLCREFVYAAIHLPEWLYVPAASLRRRVPGL